MTQTHNFDNSPKESLPPLTPEEQAQAHAKLQMLYEQLQKADKADKIKTQIFALFKEEHTSSKNLAAKADVLFASPDFDMRPQELKTLMDTCSTTLQSVESRRFKYLVKNKYIKAIYDIESDSDFTQDIFQAHCLNGTADTVKFLLNRFDLKSNPSRFYKSISFCLQKGRIETGIYLLEHVALDWKQPLLAEIIQSLKPELQAAAQKAMLTQNVFTPNLTGPTGLKTKAVTKI